MARNIFTCIWVDASLVHTHSTMEEQSIKCVFPSILYFTHWRTTLDVIENSTFTTFCYQNVTHSNDPTHKLIQIKWHIFYLNLIISKHYYFADLQILVPNLGSWLVPNLKPMFLAMNLLTAIFWAQNRQLDNIIK